MFDLSGTIFRVFDFNKQELTEPQNGYFGIDLKNIILEPAANGKSQEVEVITTLYARSEASRKEWIRALRLASKTIPFEDRYHLGTKIGKGRFSVVHECTNLESGEEFAVKSMNFAFFYCK